MYGLGEIDLSDPVSDDPLNDSLVSWWLPLENNWGGTTLGDLCGRNHGTLTNGPTWAAGENGFGALSFDGSDDYVSLGSGHNIGTMDRTLCAFFVPAANANQYVCMCPFNEVFDVDGERCPVGIGVQVAGIFGGPYDGTQSLTPALNVPNFVAVSVAGTTASIYQATGDGLFLRGTKTYTGTVNSSVLMVMGRYNQGIGRYLNGRILSVTRHSRALSAPEIAAFYDQTLRGFPDTLRRLRRVARAAAAPAGNRRRRVIICGSR